jgi:hypothetical protein
LEVSISFIAVIGVRKVIRSEFIGGNYFIYSSNWCKESD